MGPPAPRVGNPRWGGAPLTLVGTPPPWPPPPWEIASPRAGTPLGAYIKEGRGRAAAPLCLVPPSPCYTSSSSRSRLAKPSQSSTASTTTPSCCWIIINLSFPLAGSRRRRRLPSRMCVERGGAVRLALVIGDLDHVEYDYIITVLLNASARDLQRYEIGRASCRERV